MKQMKVATSTFAGVLIFCLLFHLYTHCTAVKIKTACAELYGLEDTAAYLSSLYKLKEDTLKYADIWSILINHTETSSVVALITTGVAYAENGDFATSKVSLAQMENAIEKMLDRERLSLHNVF